MITEEEMGRCFCDVGSSYPYGKISAEYVEAKEFTIKWELRPNSLTFFVSDYVKNMPVEILESIVETIFKRISGKKVEPYEEKVREYLSSPDMVKKNQAIYVRRHGPEVKVDAGEHKSLKESYWRLVDRGLVEFDPYVYFVWSDLCGSPYVGHNSVVMKVVMMNDELDRSDVSDELLDYCLWTRIAHINLGFNTVGDYRGEKYQEEIDRFPDTARLNDELARYMLKI